MEVDDAISYIVDFLRNPRAPSGYSSTGYDITLQILLICYLREVENCPEYIQYPQDCPGSREASMAFYDAAWELCRRGILRPSVRHVGEPGTSDSSGYSITQFGRHWISTDAPEPLLGGPERMSKLFEKHSARFGPVFLQRAGEAARCHAFGQYLACCAMCGAAAETILLAVGTAASDDSSAVLATYRAANGRRKVIDRIVGQRGTAIAEPFRNATGLLSYWRDEAAHGLSSSISEIEAHEALGRLMRFAGFVADNWEKLTQH